MNHYSIINGEFVLKNEAKILISDLSVQRGYAIFDYFRTKNFHPIFLEDHLDRFFYSAAQMRLEAGFSREELQKMIFTLIRKNEIADSGIRITLTGGYSEDGYSIAKANLLITQSPFSFNTENFNKGIRLITYEHQRQLPHVKTIDYLMAIHLQPFLKEKNADDLLYFDNNEIRECPRSNFFAVTEKNEVVTPAKKILKGITRKKILEFSQFNIKEASIYLENLSTIKEAFITSTTKNILPVLQINGKPVGNGKPGEISEKIYEKMLLLKENPESN